MKLLFILIFVLRISCPGINQTQQSDLKQNDVAGKINDDYLFSEGEYLVYEGITEKTEGPVIVKRNGIYHLLVFGSTVWAPNPARYFTSKSLTGPWISQGNPCQGVNPDNGFGQEKTYGGQPTFILCTKLF